MKAFRLAGGGVREAQMITVQMLAVPAESRTHITLRAVGIDEPLVRGSGPINYTCAGCGRVLLEMVRTDQVAGKAFCCRACDTISHIPVEPMLP